MRPQVPDSSLMELGDLSQFVDSTAAKDVRDTIGWLQSEGWELTSSRGGPTESFGNVLLEFRRSRWTITVTRDRSQWMLDVEPEGWKVKTDLDPVIRVMKALPYPPHDSRSSSRPLAGQLPPGVSWRRELPVALDWMQSTPGAEEMVRKKQHERARYLFG